MSELPYVMERSILIQAEPETVFGFFMDSRRWAAWWGAESTIDPRPGGDLRIRHPNGFISTGKVIALERPTRFVFTFSLQSNPPTRAEDSRVTIRLEPHAEGTRLHLTHELANESVRDLMHQGWRFHLSVFSNAIADEVHAGAAQLADQWFGLWAEPDAAVRAATLDRIAIPAVCFRDQYSALEGASEIVTHLGAAQRFMPGIRMERRGAVRHCQGTVLTDWVALGADGKERMSGTNVFVLGSTRKIVSVTGIANTSGA
jgi:uncharacterized protein YndB with AHSA1/START domain